MLKNAPLQIIGQTNVEALIIASKNIDIKHCTILSRFG